MSAQHDRVLDGVDQASNTRGRIGMRQRSPRVSEITKSQEYLERIMEISKNKRRVPKVRVPKPVDRLERGGSRGIACLACPDVFARVHTQAACRGRNGGTIGRPFTVGVERNVDCSPYTQTEENQGLPHPDVDRHVRIKAGRYAPPIYERHRGTHERCSADRPIAPRSADERAL